MSFKFTRKINSEITSIRLNIPQSLLLANKAKHQFAEWGRGGGKSTYIAWRMKELAIQMPRGSFALVGETYNQILTRTLPSTIAGLEMLGYIKDVHYFVGRKPPAKWKWPEAYQPPLNYDHAIYWYTGAVFHLISLDMPNSGRGLNIDAAVGDEAALFDYTKLFNNVLTTIRGNLDRFSHCPLHQSTFFATSVPMTTKGNWLFKMEEQAIIDPSDIYYLRAPSAYNYKNLGPKWFKENRRIMTDMVYSAEIDNIRPGKVEGGFYPTFNDKWHCRDYFNNSYLLNLGYDNIKKAQGAKCLADADLLFDQPIDIACDYGGHINTIVAHQEYGNEARWLNAMHVKSPSLIDQLINDFCDYYSGYLLKKVNYWYDHTALGGKVGTSAKTYREMVIEAFINRGWDVTEYNIGVAPEHRDRYLFWGISFQEKDKRLPCHRFNLTNCKYLIVSVNNTGLLPGAKSEEKDKRPEKNKNVAQEEAPHYSDAMDTLGYGKYSSRTKDQTSYWLPST